LTESVRYSGSPVAYSFSEAAHLKGCWLVDLGATGLEEVRFVEAPVQRRLACVEGTLEELLADDALADAEDCWVQATLTDAVRPAQAMDRLRVRFPHAITLRFAPPGSDPTPGRPSTIGRAPHEIALDFVRHVRGEPASGPESDLLRTALECCTDDAELVPGRDSVVSG
jgi:exonuclease SbcD